MQFGELCDNPSFMEILSNLMLMFSCWALTSGNTEIKIRIMAGREVLKQKGFGNIINASITEYEIKH
jgi:hypothetical protein